MAVVFLICFLSLAAAGIGVNFSPSYAAAFCFFFMFTVFIREVMTFTQIKEKQKKVLSIVTSLLSSAGSLALLVGSFTYAFGDDPLKRNTILSAVVSIVIFILLILTDRRKIKWNAVCGLSLFLCVLAGVFSLLNGITCPALLPVGAGALSFAAAWLVRTVGNRSVCYKALLTGGFLMETAFLVAPMLF